MNTQRAVITFLHGWTCVFACVCCVCVCLSQGTIELLRQWCARGGWHDELKASFVHIVDTQLVGCMTTTQFQKPVSDRFLQYVSLIGLPPISHTGFTLIFTAVLKR